MRKLILTLSATTLALAGATAALADHHGGKAERDNADADGNGVITQAEHKAQAAKMFSRMDVNGDGVINQADRAAHHAEAFARIDTDGNGQLSKDEFQAAHQARTAKMGEGMRRDGKREGAGRGHSGMSGMSGMGHMMLRRADADDDKSITRAEFDAAAASHFAQLDTDKSGTVSAAERQAAHEAMKARMQERRADRQPR